MGKYASKVVALAQEWVGKNESDGTHKGIIDIYNSQKKLPRNYKVKYTDAWCATTVSAIAVKLNYTDIIPTECSCQYMINKFKDIGCWKENENCKPKAGWIIFYDWDDSGKGDNKGWSDHVGIVEKVSGDTITVIEGNYANSVKRRKLEVNGKYIRGYGVPKYDAEKKTSSTATVEKETTTQKKDDSKYYDKYTGKAATLDTVLKAVGVPEKYRNNWAKRKPLATANGISNYTGKSSQNLKLIALAKQGKLKKVV